MGLRVKGWGNAGGSVLLQSDKHSEKKRKGEFFIRYSQIPSLSTFMHISGYRIYEIMHILGKYALVHRGI